MHRQKHSGFGTQTWNRFPPKHHATSTGELEADIAFKAGADLVSVLGSADDSTIAGAVKAARAHNKGIVVDLIGVP